MSLFLRKECQTLLDNVGLNNYHIQINENYKYLEIVGECGQSLCVINGIRLSRMAPAPAEIKLALELFEAFLVKHAATFKEFTKIKAEVDVIKIPQTIPEIPKINILQSNYDKSWQVQFDMENWPKQEVFIYSTGQISIDFNEHIKNPQTDPLQATFTEQETIGVRNWLLACKKYNELSKKKENLLETLNSCEI